MTNSIGKLSSGRFTRPVSSSSVRRRLANLHRTDDEERAPLYWIHADGMEWVNSQ